MNKITDINIKNKKVLIRVDFNVPIENSVIKNHFRIDSSLKTINYCLSQNASIVLMSHLGRPKSIDKKLSLAPIVEYLEEKLDTIVHFSEDSISSRAIETLRPFGVGAVYRVMGLFMRSSYSEHCGDDDSCYQGRHRRF